MNIDPTDLHATGARVAAENDFGMHGGEGVVFALLATLCGVVLVARMLGWLWDWL